MLLYFNIVGFSLIFSYFSYRNNNRIYNPIIVINFIWAFAILIHLIMYGEALELYLLIFVCLTLFNITYLIIEKGVKNYQKFKKNYHPRLNFVNIKKIIYVISIIEMVKVIYITRKMLRFAGSLQTVFFQSTLVRNLYLMRNESFLDKILGNILSYTTMLGILLIAILIAKKVKIPRIIILFWVVAEILSSLLTMSRMDIIIKTLIFLFTYLASIENPKIQFDKLKKIIPKAIFVILIVFIVIGFQRNYGFGLDNNFEIFITNIEKVLFYISSPLEAFRIILNKNEVYLGTHTLLPFYKLVSNLVSLPPRINLTNHAAVVFTNLGPTNVYSMFGLIFLDFSYIGLFEFVSIFGIISALIFNLSRNYISSRSFESILLMSLFMSFYAYIYSQSIYLLFPFTVLIFDRIFKNYIYEN